MNKKKFDINDQFPRSAIVNPDEMIVWSCKMTVDQTRENLKLFLEEVSDPNSETNKNIKERAKSWWEKKKKILAK